MKTAVHLWDALQDKEYGHTFSSEKSTFQKVYGAPAFQYYAEHVSDSMLKHELFGVPVLIFI